MPLTEDNGQAANEEARLIAPDNPLAQRTGLDASGISAFTSFAISMSIICILAGGITSFQAGFSAAGGAAIGIGWPIGCAFALIVAAAMGQIASAYPTAGGLYHWASILGGKGWGWVTAWFNLVGLITILAAINADCSTFARAGSQIEA